MAPRKMRICLLTTQDLDADPFPDDDWPCDPRPFIPDAEWHLEVLEKLTAVQRVMQLSRMDFDVFFNMCDGAMDESTPGVEVVQALERLNVPFTGARSPDYEPSRVAMKRVCEAMGIDAPAYVMAYTEDDIERASRLTFPLIVKHPSSYASIDLTEASRVTGPDELKTQASRMIEKHTAALIEEFIEGIECTVLVAENPEDRSEPITYIPMQYQFPEGQSFKHHDMKWVDYAEMKCAPVEDPVLDRRLRQVSGDLFRGLGCASFGRVDIRVDEQGRPFVLEINANCGVFYEPADAGAADLCLLSDPAGHEGFTRQLVGAALARHERSSQPWQIRLGDDSRFGVFATRSIDAGECIINLEEANHRLVTLSTVENTWAPRDVQRFDRDAWPLTDEVWAIWPTDPDLWATPNHSCDPSAWLDGLNVTARRELLTGEEVTLDFATFRNERMPSFSCQCGSPDCRGTIRGDDLLSRFVERYADHVSSYVRGRRREAGA